MRETDREVSAGSFPPHYLPWGRVWQCSASVAYAPQLDDGAGTCNAV
jgi:hypothetical protein